MYISQINQQVFFICIQPNQDILIPRKNNNASKNFRLYKNEKSILKEQEIERDHRNLVGKCLDIRKRTKNSLSGCTSQDGFFASESLTSLKEVKFSKQVFLAGKSVLNIKYHFPGFQNNNLFYPFNDQLDYIFINYFAESEITKDNIAILLSHLLIAPLTKKLFYQNVDKQIGKLLNIL